MKYIKFQELICHSSRDNEVWKVDFILCQLKNSKKRLHFVFFKNFFNKNYLRYWSKILHSFSKLVYLDLRIFSGKSEGVMREIIWKFVDLTWNDPWVIPVDSDSIDAQHRRPWPYRLPGGGLSQNFCFWRRELSHLVRRWAVPAVACLIIIRPGPGNRKIQSLPPPRLWYIFGLWQWRN